MCLSSVAARAIREVSPVGNKSHLSTSNYSLREQMEGNTGILPVQHFKTPVSLKTEYPLF